jgi:haloacetate dehalogenase
MIERMGGAVGVFKGYCDESVEVSGRSVGSGHYIPEEVPEDVLSEATGFFV